MRPQLIALCLIGCASSSSSTGLLGSHDAKTATYSTSAANVDEFAKLTVNHNGEFVAAVVITCTGGAPCDPRPVRGNYQIQSKTVQFTDSQGRVVGAFHYQLGEDRLELTNVATGDSFVMVPQPLGSSGAADGTCQYPVTCVDGSNGCADTSDPCESHGGECSPVASACVTDYDCCPGSACDNNSASPTYSCVASCNYPVTCKDGTTGCGDTSDPCAAHGGDCSNSGEACATDFDCCQNVHCDNTGTAPTYSCVP
jgi:hypothetical protein